MRVGTKYIIKEEENPWINKRQDGLDNKKNPQLKALWDKIDQKKQELFQIAFDELDAAAKERMDLFGMESPFYVKQEGVDKDGNPKEPYKMRNMFSAGNKKLPKNVLIINLTSPLACPSYHSGLCLISNGYCYAQNIHNGKPNPRYRGFMTDVLMTQMLQQYQKGNKVPMRKYYSLVEMYINVAHKVAKDAFRQSLEMVERTGIRITADMYKALWIVAKQEEISEIRLNEAGDFPCQLSVDLWFDFARKVGKKYGIRFNTYSARLLDFSKKPDNFSVMPSRDDINIGDEPKRRFKPVTARVYNSKEDPDGPPVNMKTYQPNLMRDNNGEYYYKCPCVDDSSNCNNCQICFHTNQTGVPYTIYVALHGTNSANGLRYLFTDKEIKQTMKTAIENGWITPEERTIYNSRATKNRLSNFSDKIMNQRNRDN